jgi:hypothetical protein
MVNVISEGCELGVKKNLSLMFALEESAWSHRGSIIVLPLFFSRPYIPSRVYLRTRTSRLATG